MPGSVGVMSITPFDARGGIDVAALEDHLGRLGQHPLSVYLCSQGSGEGLSLSLEEKEAVYRCAVEVLGGRCEVVGAGVGLTGDTDSALAQVALLSATGVDALQVFPPRTGALRPRDREIAHYYEEVVEVARCPVVLGENTTLVGYALGPDLVGRLLARHEEIAGLSYTAPGGLGSLVDLLAACEERQVPVRTGWLHHLPSMAALGGAGVLCFDANVAPGLAAACWQALCDGSPGSMELLGALYALNALLSRWGNPASIKAALGRLGLPAGQLRRPLLALNDEEVERLGADLERLVDRLGLERWL